MAPASLRERISLRMSIVFTGSKPLNGSSSMSRDGLCTTVVMNWTFCAIPLESSSTFLFHQDSMPNLTNQVLSSCSAADEDIPLRRARNIACSPTFILR